MNFDELLLLLLFTLLVNDYIPVWEMKIKSDNIEFRVDEMRRPV